MKLTEEQLKQAKMDQLNALAKAAEPTGIEREQLFAASKHAHELDVLGFSFKCVRWDSWLQLFIARKANKPRSGTVEPTKSYATALNLLTLQTMTLEKGHEPDLLGEIGYYAKFYKDSTEVFPSLPWLPDYREMFRNYQPGYILDSYGRMSEPPTYRTANFVRHAVDDQIHFGGIGCTLHTPAGMGEAVYQKILEARDEAKAA